jgi:hypothetical protein
MGFGMEYSLAHEAWAMRGLLLHGLHWAENRAKGVEV